MPATVTPRPADPNASPFEKAVGSGYGYTDYAPSIYTDISPTMTPGVGSTTIVPYRDKTTAANGLLKGGQTRISEIIDGTSNTIAFIECAGRDERFVSQYSEGLYAAFIGQRGAGPAPGGLPSVPHRYWRWANPGNAFGTSGQPNNKGLPTNSGVPWSNSTATAGNQAGPNEEPYSFHQGGVNALFGDGSVRFVKDSVNLVAFRGILTLAGREVVSADSF